MMPNTTGEWIPEKILAEQLGVSRAIVREKRPAEASGLVAMIGGAFCWRKSAAEAAAASLNLPLRAQTDVKPPEAELLTVASRPGAGGYHYPNRNVIKAARPNGELVVVRVMDSRKYTTHLRTGQPMTFQARKSASGFHWTLVGREPRFTGQW